MKEDLFTGHRFEGDYTYPPLVGPKLRFVLHLVRPTDKRELSETSKDCMTPNLGSRVF